jgi:hypothetical protein
VHILCPLHMCTYVLRSSICWNKNELTCCNCYDMRTSSIS